MKSKAKLMVLAVLIAFSTAYAIGLVNADEAKVAEAVEAPDFKDSAVLVYFEFGGGEVKRTVLVNASVVDIGGTKFLTGKVNNHLPNVENNFAEVPSFIAITRIVLMQQFAVPESGASGQALKDLFG